MTSPLVYISVLNWNGHKDTIDCLQSLFAMNYENYRIIVVDNGSIDGSLVQLQKFADKIILLPSGSNLGYTGGNNLAIQHAITMGAEYIWLLNNDAVVLPDTLTKVVAAMAADAKIGLASPVIYYAEPVDTVWNCGAALAMAKCECHPLTDIAQARSLQQTAPERIALFGTALLVRRSLIDIIGFLDDRFFAYYEDLDYSIRSIEAGFRNVVVFDSAIFHKKTLAMGTTTPKPYWHYFITRNECMMWRKHIPTFRGLKGALWYSRYILRRLEQRSEDVVAREASLAGLWDAWRGITGGYDPSRRMPQPLRALLVRHPGFWRRVLDAL